MVQARSGASLTKGSYPHPSVFMQRCASLVAHTTLREVSPDQAHKYESYTAYEGEITLCAWTHNAPTAPAATALPSVST
jgi:hypothetical protein